MKKIFVIVFSTILLLATAACASTPASSPTTTTAPTTTITAAPSPTQTPNANTPMINIKKTSEPKELIYGAGSVTYTYEVINLGTVALSNVSVTDDKLGLVKYVSGDVNSDGILQPTEKWIYTAKTTLSETTTSTATAKGSANGLTATDVANTRVVVSSATVPGGELPNTATPWFNILFGGCALILLAAAFWRIRKLYE